FAISSKRTRSAICPSRVCSKPPELAPTNHASPVGTSDTQRASRRKPRQCTHVRNPPRPEWRSRSEMKNLICFMCLCVGVAVASQTVFATPQNNYKTYANARFKYSISYPTDLLIPQGESENGDGQVFREKSGSVEMRVYGGYNVSNESLRSRYAELIRKWNNVTNKVIRRDLFVVSSLEKG